MFTTLSTANQVVVSDSEPYYTTVAKTVTTTTGGKTTYYKTTRHRDIVVKYVDLTLDAAKSLRDSREALYTRTQLITLASGKACSVSIPTAEIEISRNGCGSYDLTITVDDVDGILTETEPTTTSEQSALFEEQNARPDDTTPASLEVTSAVYDTDASTLTIAATLGGYPIGSDPSVFSLYYYDADGNLVQIPASQITATSTGYDTYEFVVSKWGYTCNTGTVSAFGVSASWEYEIEAGYYVSDGTKYDWDSSTTVITKAVILSLNRPNSITEIYSPIVTKVEARAFENRTNLKVIKLPSAEEIGDYAFDYCTGLVTVSLPSAQTIGEMSFDDCTSIRELSLDSATTIGGGAFTECIQLTSVSLDSLVTVPFALFAGCTNLTYEISIPNAQTVSDRAFVRSNVTSIYLDSAVTIGSGAFGDSTYGYNDDLQFVSIPKITMAEVESSYSTWGLLSGVRVTCSDGDVVIP